MLIMSQESQIYQESRPKEINFNSNVERAVYEVFNKVCEGLGYDWRKYTSDEKYCLFYATVIQRTDIDGYPDRKFYLGRKVKDIDEIRCTVEIVTPKGKKFTEYEIKKMLTGRPDPIYASHFFSNEELAREKRNYGAQEISDKKIDEVAREILKEFE